jgi:hypothetical protein
MLRPLSPVRDSKKMNIRSNALRRQSFELSKRFRWGELLKLRLTTTTEQLEYSLRVYANYCKRPKVEEKKVPIVWFEYAASHSVSKRDPRTNRRLALRQAFRSKAR